MPKQIAPNKRAGSRSKAAARATISAPRRPGKSVAAPVLGAASAIAQKLVHVGPKDPAGRIFRRYWIPVEVAGDLGQKPKPIRILGEDLVLFRFPNGEPGLLGPKCAHRNAGIQHGTPEARGLRCCYHG